RAVVRAVTRPDATVVHHVVQAFGGVHRGSHGAHLLAGGVLALLAHHWLLTNLSVVLGPLEVAFDAHPGHLAALGDLGLADDRDVVLRLARHDASAAAAALVQVDGHGPLVPVVGYGRQPQIEQGRVVHLALDVARVNVTGSRRLAVLVHVFLEVGVVATGCFAVDVVLSTLLANLPDCIDGPEVLGAGEDVRTTACFGDGRTGSE